MASRPAAPMVGRPREVLRSATIWRSRKHQVTVFFSSLAFGALLRICAFAFAFCFVAPQAPDLSVRKTIGLSIVFDCIRFRFSSDANIGEQTGGTLVGGCPGMDVVFPAASGTIEPTAI